MEREATEEMLRYTAEVCGKYREIKMLAEEAEAAWKQSLALMAESKYPSEKEMYEREAAEELEKYESARSWMKLVSHSVQSEGRKGKAGFETELSGRRNDESGSGGQKGRNLYEPVYSNPVQKERSC